VHNCIENKSKNLHWFRETSNRTTEKHLEEEGKKREKRLVYFFPHLNDI